MEKKEIKLSEVIKSEMEKYETTSDKIRFLNSKGFSKSAISNILNKRYQHVRNVLVQDAVIGKVFTPRKK